jgi:hypothetical protein
VKTTPALLIGSLETAKSILWFLPMQLMHEQYLSRCKHHSMTCKTWTRATSLDRPPHHILITIEHTESVPLHLFIDSIVAHHLLSLVVVDEAHLVLTHDSFRAVMDTLKWLGDIPPDECPYRNTLLPMAWLIAQDEHLTCALVNSKLFKGVLLNSPSQPFVRWIISDTHTPLSNLLETLAFFIDTIGPPT